MREEGERGRGERREREEERGGERRVREEEGGGGESGCGSLAASLGVSVLGKIIVTVSSGSQQA